VKGIPTHLLINGSQIDTAEDGSLLLLPLKLSAFYGSIFAEVQALRDREVVLWHSEISESSLPST